MKVRNVEVHVVSREQKSWSVNKSSRQLNSKILTHSTEVLKNLTEIRTHLAEVLKDLVGVLTYWASRKMRVVEDSTYPNKQGLSNTSGLTCRRITRFTHTTMEKIHYYLQIVTGLCIYFRRPQRPTSPSVIVGISGTFGIITTIPISSSTTILSFSPQVYRFVIATGKGRASRLQFLLLSTFSSF